MLCFPNAKINLGLNVTGKRSDGFHNIETVFVPVELTDMLEFVPDPEQTGGQVTLSFTGLPVDGPVETNLCVRAYRILDKDFHLPAIRVHLHKIIPPGAGLGGGSSDAAFMLKHLSYLFGLGLSDEQLMDYASELGSDCAFFIQNRPLFAFEKGNSFREIASFRENLMVMIVNPGIHIKTAEAYSEVIPKKPENPLEEMIRLPVSKWRDRITNDFEKGIFQKYPLLGRIKNGLYEAGAVYASMSGSGSSVYGLFEIDPPRKDLFPEMFCWIGALVATRIQP
jgi:4-diphosphocytidyl-2-C-methyl-D-erythritol kinase